MTAHVVIVGSGLLGCTAGLLAAQRGHDVTIVERAAQAWNGASAAGEGKVHLGLIYAQGDDATHTNMLDGALAFSRVLDHAVGRRLPWNSLVGEAFINVVMPDSQLDVDELSLRYARLDRLAQSRTDTGDYLGRPLDAVCTPGVVTEHLTGLPALRTAERAVEPARLRAALLQRIAEHPRIRLRLGRDVLALEPTASGVDVRHRAASGGERAIDSMTADAVLNCSWESQAALHNDGDDARLSFRYKLALSIPNGAIDTARCRTMTLVIGPYGDVVRRADDVYASWYPAGRLVHEHGRAPSATARSLVAAVDAGHPAVDAQLDALIALRALPALDSSARRRVRLSGGWILAQGETDIDHRDSGLHQRPDGGIGRRGRVVSPYNTKFTTAPLSAERAMDALAAALDDEARS